MRTQAIILVAVAALAASAGYFLARKVGLGAEAGPGLSPGATVAASQAPLPDELVGQPRPDFVLQDAAGNPVAASDFDGKVLLLNFWASWCAPCVEEMPMLSDLQRDHADEALQVIGIALEDPQLAQAFASGLALAYPLLFGLADAMLVGRRYGNRSGMLPYSVLIDARGIVRWTHLGIVDREDLEARLRELR